MPEIGQVLGKIKEEVIKARRERVAPASEPDTTGIEPWEQRIYDFMKVSDQVTPGVIERTDRFLGSVASDYDNSLKEAQKFLPKPLDSSQKS